MVVEVDTLTEALCFVAEELSRVLGGDTGARVEGLRRMPQGFYGNALSGFSRNQASPQDHGIEWLGTLSQPVPQDRPGPDQDSGPCLVQPIERLSWNPARHQQGRARWSGDPEQTFQAVRPQVQKPSMAVASVSLRPWYLETRDAEVLAEPRRTAIEKLLA